MSAVGTEEEYEEYEYEGETYYVTEEVNDVSFTLCCEPGDKQCCEWVGRQELSHLRSRGRCFVVLSAVGKG
jgi:hypothetical protein